MTPRPGVDWPSASAVLAHDAQIVAAGITTVFDALSIGDVNPKGKRMQQLPKMLEAIGEAAASGDARADHRLHLRCEVSHPQTLEVFRELVEHPLVQLVSVMDHAPGQRQFARLEKYREVLPGQVPPERCRDGRLHRRAGSQLRALQRRRPCGHRRCLPGTRPVGGQP